MLDRASLLSWWPFSGYSGSGNASSMSLLNSILGFLVRFILFNIATLILWLFIRSYYEAIHWFFTIKASQILGPITFSDPEIISGFFHCLVGNIPWQFKPVSITFSIFIGVPLLLSSSGISLLNRIEMTMIGFIVLFCFEIFVSLIIINAKVYEYYPLVLQKGIRIDQIIAYSPLKYSMFTYLKYLLQSSFQFALPLGVWIGMVSYYKRSKKQHWIRKLF